MDYLLEVAENIPTVVAVLLFSNWVIWKYRERIGIASLGSSVLVSFLITAALLLSCLLFAYIDRILMDSNWIVIIQGGIFFGPLFCFGIIRAMKLKVRETFDVIAMIISVTLLVARLNCLRTGCCQGLIILNTGLQWPVREAELLLAASLLVYFWKRNEDNSGNGELYPLFLILHGIGRFFIEGFVNIPYRLLGVHPVHIWSVISVIIGCSIYFEMQAQKDAKTKAKHRRV